MISAVPPQEIMELATVNDDATASNTAVVYPWATQVKSIMPAINIAKDLNLTGSDSWFMVTVELNSSCRSSVQGFVVLPFVQIDSG